MALPWQAIYDLRRIFQIRLVFLLLLGIAIEQPISIGPWQKSFVALAGPAERRVQRIIEQDINQLAAGKVDTKLFLVSVKVEKVEGKKQNKLPFTPFFVDSSLLDFGGAGGVGPAFEDAKFSITMSIDNIVANDTVNLLKEVITSQFAIDGKNRVLTIRRRKIFDPKNDPSNARAVEAARVAAEQKKLEIERSEAKLEAEKMRLEVARKELEMLKSRANDHVGPEGLKLAKAFQLVLVGVIVALGAILCFRLFGNALRLGFTSVADGIRSAGTGIGNAMMARHESVSQGQGKNDGSVVATPEKKSLAPVVDEPAWSTGTPEFETYIAQVQEKIEQLSRQRNFNFTRHFVDLIEDEATLPMAAAILLALPKEAIEQLVKDIASDHIRKLHNFLGSEGGLAAAKALRRQSLQQFYGRIAMDEFTGNPLAQLQQVGWLTRIAAEDMASLAAKLTDEHRLALLACLSPECTKRMIIAAKTREIRQVIITTLPKLGEVKLEQIQKFIEFGKNSIDVVKLIKDSNTIIDHVRHLGEIIRDLDPEDQETIAKSMENNPDLQERLRRTYLPFRAITRVPPEWVAQLLENRSNEQVGVLLFAAPQIVRDFIIGTLPPIRAETIAHDLKTMDGTAANSVRRRRESQSLQKELSRQILQLVNNGTIELAAYEPAPAAAAPQETVQTPKKNAGAA